MTSLRQLAWCLVAGLTFSAMTALALVVEAGRRIRSLVSVGQNDPSHNHDGDPS